MLSGLQPDIAISFIDDVLIHGGATLREHLERVVLVLDRIGGAGYTFRPDKCYFGMESLEWLGCRVGGGTVRPDDSKTAQIREAPFPETADDLHKWVGLVQWCSKNLPNAAFELAPLHARLANKAAAVWPPTEEQQRCFDDIKAWLTDEKGPVLRLPDFTKPFYLLCDAARTIGLGVVVVQLDDDGC